MISGLPVLLTLDALSLLPSPFCLLLSFFRFDPLADLGRNGSDQERPQAQPATATSHDGLPELRKVCSPPVEVPPLGCGALHSRDPPYALQLCVLGRDEPVPADCPAKGEVDVGQEEAATKRGGQYRVSYTTT